MRWPLSLNVPEVSRSGGISPAMLMRVPSMLNAMFSSFSSSFSSPSLAAIRPSATDTSMRASVTVPPKRLRIAQRRAPLASHHGQSCLTAVGCIRSLMAAKLTCGEVLPKATESDPNIEPSGLETAS
ncbi:hypothetical protein D9M72_586080 [compost metagenome]